jgi:hypothetical protein
MFRTITLRGPRGALTWNGGDAARLGAFWLSRREASRQWSLTATLDSVDSYRLKQVPLLFIAPRLNYPRGLWCFPVVPGSLRVERTSVSALLAPPEGW